MARSWCAASNASSQGFPERGAAQLRKTDRAIHVRILDDAEINQKELHAAAVGEWAASLAKDRAPLNRGEAAPNSEVGEGDRALRALVAVGAPSLVEALRTQLLTEHLAVEIVAARSGMQALLTAADSDLIVLHVRFAGLDSLETLRRLRASGNTTPVMMLSESSPPSDRAAGLDAGADDWMTTPFDASEFRARVRALLRRRGSRLVNVLRYGSLSFDTAAHVARVHGVHIELSPREASLLHMLLIHFNGVVTRERILDEFYGLCESAGINTIEVYVSRLRRKLQGCGLTIKTVHGRGYVLGMETAHPAG